jgi:hypothetical protein
MPAMKVRQEDGFWRPATIRAGEIPLALPTASFSKSASLQLAKEPDQGSPVYGAGLWLETSSLQRFASYWLSRCHAPA